MSAQTEHNLWRVLLEDARERANASPDRLFVNVPRQANMSIWVPFIGVVALIVVKVFVL